MCTFVTRIIPPSGQVIPALPPLLPSSPCFWSSLGRRTRLCPRGEKATREGEEEKDKEKLNRFFLFIHRQPNAATEWENKASLQISLFVLQIPTFPTDPRPDEPLNAE